jgi:hypothetical protein
VQLENGLRVFLVEDHEVPLVKGTLAMRGGQRAVPAEKVHFPTSRAGLRHGEGGKGGHAQLGMPCMSGSSVRYLAVNVGCSHRVVGRRYNNIGHRS